MAKYLKCKDMAEGELIAEEIYDNKCDRLGCLTPKSKRVTRFGAIIIEDLDINATDAVKEKIKKSDTVELIIEDEDLDDVDSKHVSKLKDEPELECTQSAKIDLEKYKEK